MAHHSRVVTFTLVMWFAAFAFAVGVAVGVAMVHSARAQEFTYGKLAECEAPASYIGRVKQSAQFKSARVFTKSETVQLVAAVAASTGQAFAVDTIAVVYLRDAAIVIFGKGGLACEFFASHPDVMRSVIKSALGQGV